MELVYQLCDVTEVVFDSRAKIGETVNIVDRRVCSCGRAPSRAEEECRCADCHKETGNTVEVLLVLEEVGHGCFQNVDDVKSQDDDHEDLTGEKSETCKQNDRSANEQRCEFQRLEEDGFHCDQHDDAKNDVEGDVCVGLEF